MAVNVDFYLKKRCEDIQIEKALRLEELYNDIDNPKLRIIFATLHQEFNRLISFMYNKTNGHFNAVKVNKKMYKKLKIKMYKKCNQLCIGSGTSESIFNLSFKR